MPFCQQIFLANSHNISKWHPGSRGGTGSAKQKTLKNLGKNKILYYFRSINCTNVSIHGCNCCKTGIEVSKCVYLACMAVKIEHTVGSHNHDMLQQCILMFMPAEVWGLNQSKHYQNICFCPSKLVCIHGKLKKNKLCSIQCYISPLGSLPVISINVLS